MRRTGGRFVGRVVIAAVVAIILIGAGLLLWARCPTPTPVNARGRRIFVVNDDSDHTGRIKLP